MPVTKRTKGVRVCVPTGRPRTKLVNVASPTVPGAVEQVERVIDRGDGISFLQKKFPREYRAAERVRYAWDVVHGQIGNVMDFDRTRGGGTPGSPPIQRHLLAATDLNQCRNWLYPEDHRIVMLIAGEGCPVSATAGIVHKRNATRGEIERVGIRFREALAILADTWWGTPNSKEEYIPHVWRDQSNNFTVSAGVIEPRGVVHATGHRIFRNGR